MPFLYFPPQTPLTASSTPLPQDKKNRTTNENGALRAKWTVEEDRQLVESWINVSTNPIIGADHKKSSFWSKMTLAYNHYTPYGAQRELVRFAMPVGTELHHGYPNGAVMWGGGIPNKPKWGK